MVTRRFAILLCLLLSCISVWGQTRGGGRTPAPAPRTTRSTPTQPTNPAMPDTVPIHTAKDEGKIEFRTETILVQVPIVITDKSGNHIHGLSKEDVRVFEDGKEQKLSTLEEIVASTGKFPLVASKPGEFSNLTLSEQQPRTVMVIALDTVNTPFLDQSTGRRELVKFLAKNIDSGQVLALMIITSRGLKIVQGLTGDPTQLMEALKRASGEMPAMHGIDIDAQADAAEGDNPEIPSTALGSDPNAAVAAFVERGDAIYSQFKQQNAIETTMNAFLGIAWSLSGVPGRKSLIWATGGFPFAISSPDDVPGGYLSPLYERTMAALTAAQISVYPVDIRGLAVASPMGDASQSRVRSGPALMRQAINRSWLQQGSIDTLNEFADMTGGKAFYNTNDLASSFKRAADDASAYYLASYYLDKSNRQAGWRQLKVKVDKKDTEIRARKGFFVTNATIHLDRTRNSDLTYALNSPIEGTGIPVTVKWLGNSGDPGKKTAEFQVRLPPDSVSIENSDGKSHLNFEVAAAAFLDNSKTGQPAKTSSKTVNGVVTDAQVTSLRNSGIAMTDGMELVPGHYTVRVVIRDNVTGKMGSVTAPLVVD